MTYTNCRRIKITVWFVPPYGTGHNSFWKPQSDGSVILLYKYHQCRKIGDRVWHTKYFN